jgi:hypothetical protein
MAYWVCVWWSGLFEVFYFHHCIHSCSCADSPLCRICEAGSFCDESTLASIYHSCTSSDMARLSHGCCWVTSYGCSKGRQCLEMSSWRSSSPKWQLDPQDEDSVVLQNIGIYLPNDTASHPMRLEYLCPVRVLHHVCSSSAWESDCVWYSRFWLGEWWDYSVLGCDTMASV